MISESCDLAEFFQKVKAHNMTDIIYTAEQEATSAERAFYHPKRCLGDQKEACREYVGALKSFISYLRYNIHPPVKEAWLEHFKQAESAIARSRRSPSRAPSS